MMKRPVLIVVAINGGGDPTVSSKALLAATDATASEAQRSVSVRERMHARGGDEFWIVGRDALRTGGLNELINARALAARRTNVVTPPTTRKAAHLKLPQAPLRAVHFSCVCVCVPSRDVDADSEGGQRRTGYAYAYVTHTGAHAWPRHVKYATYRTRRSSRKRTWTSHAHLSARWPPRRIARTS